MVQGEKKKKQPFPYKNQPVNIILNEKKTQNKYIIQNKYIRVPKSKSLKIDI